MTYTALDPHYFWDGKPHYWTGMYVNGMDKQPDYQLWWDMKYNHGKPTKEYIKKLKEFCRKRRYTYAIIAEKIGISESKFEHIVAGQGFIDGDTKERLHKLTRIKPELTYPEGLEDGFKQLPTRGGKD